MANSTSPARKRCRARRPRSEFDSRVKSANAAFKHYAGRDASALARLQLADGTVLADKIEFVRLMRNVGSSAPAPTRAGSPESARADQGHPGSGHAERPRPDAS